MAKRRGISIFFAFAAVLLLTPSASASTEAGWTCTATDTEANWTLLAAGSSGFPLSPVVLPEGPKVITNWRVTVGPGLAPIAQRLEVFEVQNEASGYKKIGESATETLVEGMNSFLTRIPVTEGDSVGLYGPAGTLLCEKEVGAISLLYEGGVASGEGKPFEAMREVGTPVRVVVEDDRDGDGYGDERQDGCPASAAYQGECPRVKPGLVDVVAKRNAILITAEVDSDAAVKVFGFVKWRQRQSRTATRSTTKRGHVLIAFSSGPPRSLAAGVHSTFRLTLPKAVSQRLKRLSPMRELRARIAVRATDLAGRNTQRKAVVVLRGTGHHS